MNYTEKNRGRNRPFHSSSTDAGMRIRGQSLLDNKSWKLSWCIDIRYDSNGKQDQTPAKWLNSDTSTVRVPLKECSWLTLPVRELLCLTAFLHPHPSPREGWWYQSSLSAGSRPCFPCLCSFPAVGARANRADGSWEAAGTSRHGAGTGPLPLLWEKEPGVSVPHLLCRGAFLYQMVKSAGTGFSFPPKLDKLKSNELVRGKINPVHSLQKAPPFYWLPVWKHYWYHMLWYSDSFGGTGLAEDQKLDTSVRLLCSAGVGAATPAVLLNFSSLCASRKAKANTSWT